jgi:hypothetical protein
MNQWDPNFGRGIICEKSTEEGDPAATREENGHSLKVSSKAFAAIANK